MTILSSKNSLRQNVRSVLLSNDESFFRQCGLSLFGILSQWQPYCASQRILAFSSFNDEIDTSPILQASGKEIFLPKTKSDFTMDFYCNGKLFSRPCPTDLILVPGLAFDIQGNRLGRGKGYYDRFLPQCTEAIFCGICCDLQLTDHVPTEAHDATMDFIITDKEIIPCSKSL